MINNIETTGLKSKIARTKMNEIKLYITKISNTFFSLKPFFNSLWDMWSVPPVVGFILFLILWLKITRKSKSGMVKNRNIGLRLKSKEFTPPGFQTNKILKKPRQKPINKLPESPR